MSDNALVPASFEQLPSTQIGGDELYTELAKGGDYLGRLQLFTKGRAINKELIRPGHYGIPEGDDEVVDLGNSVNILPLARRPKAIDMTDSEALVISYDMQSSEFQRIQAKSAESDSHCQFGPSFMVYEQSQNRFLEFFCGNKSNRIEAKKLFPYLPLTQAAIDARAANGENVTDLKPHGPIAVALKVKLVENKRGSWHVPMVTVCAVPIVLPAMKVIAREIERFLTASNNGVEKVAEEKAPRAR